MLTITTTDNQVILETGGTRFAFAKGDIRYHLTKWEVFFRTADYTFNETWANGITVNGTLLTPDNAVEELEVITGGSGGATVAWGGIGGNIADQADLAAAFGLKADKLNFFYTRSTDPLTYPNPASDDLGNGCYWIQISDLPTLKDISNVSVLADGSWVGVADMVLKAGDMIRNFNAQPYVTYIVGHASTSDGTITLIRF
ncbi:MAG: hypothetical protein LBL79_02645 [Prevotella sp.]|jgi:hypothetical protein|nr:hypothetical protein [Prevotella sp.]